MIEIKKYKFEFKGQIVTVTPNRKDCSKYTVQSDSDSWIISGEDLKQNNYTPFNKSAEKLLRSIV